MDQSINQKPFIISLLDEAALLQFAKQFSAICAIPATIYLSGELGAGKTTFVRGLLQGLGYHGKVKSPSYTLVEPYQINNNFIYHFDLYRIKDPAEVELLGLRDYSDGTVLLLIEWPERGSGQLPPADLICNFSIIPKGRTLTIQAKSPLGQKILQKLSS